VGAGVRSIEHGTYLSDETLRLMKEKGTAIFSFRLIPTTLGKPGRRVSGLFLAFHAEALRSLMDKADEDPSEPTSG
jgi:imidazolonepropionase-like amidohydrolase